ncbi:MAG: S46 family peptidase [Tidjanibacter sp.]|nr:S46 family peptidase [Tidjanibacter sp.]
MKKLLVSIFALLSVFTLSADEGMWLLPLLKKQNIKQMQKQGLRLSAEDIYSVNNNSLKDAIVIFGGGCTGEIVSPEGLVFTNHHCGFGSIQALSSVEHDYLKNGYWAMNNAEELPAKGLSVKFVRNIKDVSKEILKGVKDDMTAEQRSEQITSNSKAYIEKYGYGDDKFKYLEISDMFGGNQYFAFDMEVYPDVRFVGAPPQSVGKFGGETDNWMWPRHTGDFSVFRIYAAPDGISPAEFSTDNVPYQAPVHLKVSLDGYNEGDFAMVIGFPGSTDRYMTSFEIDAMLNVSNPNRIFIRTERENILSRHMLQSDKVRIQYASKFASSSNYRKNSIGMSRGVEKLGVKAQKEAIQADFTTWVNSSSKRSAKYGDALPLIESAVASLTPIDNQMQIISEALLRAVEMIRNSRRIALYARNHTAEEVDAFAEAFYKDYDETVDREVAKRIFRYVALEKADEMPDFMTIGGVDTDSLVDALYDASSFSSYDKFAAADRSTFMEDPAVVLAAKIGSRYNELRAERAPFDNQFEEGHRKFVAGLLEMESDKAHYPDANFTMRLTYGTILPYSPADGVLYNYYTTLKGVMDKEDVNNPVEFTVPEKLKQLYGESNFGQYTAPDGTVHTCFLSTNDITGGNSGSPVLNADGELIGLAFDGNWEAMSGDIAFEPELQRCINVDVRYVLFLIEKLGGAEWLINEIAPVHK